jgi:hypothetical protein
MAGSGSHRIKTRYSDSIDYLVATIIYLGTNDTWWARTPKTMADELQLKEHALKMVYEDFPGLFRKSARVSQENGQSHYSLQARYARRQGPDFSEPDETTHIAPLDLDQLNLLLEFVAKQPDRELTRLAQEQSNRAGLRTNFVAAGAAIIAALAAIAGALIPKVTP